MSSNRVALVILAMIVLAAVALAYREASWRSQHALLEAPVASPGGSIVAEVRMIEATSQQPYDKVVFLRRDWVPLLSLDSHFLFAGDCSELKVSWMDAAHVSIGCRGVAAMPTYEDEDVLGVSARVFIEQ